MVFDFAALLPYASLFVQGVAFSLGLIALAGLSGFCLAVGLAEAQNSSRKVIVWPVRAYIELVRNTPFLIQLFFIYFGIASLGFRLGAGFAAYLALTLNIAAYFAEILRSGLQSTAKGQIEAGKALGLSYWRVFFLVVLPPAIAKVWPTLVSQFVLVFLGSSVVSQISAEDLTFQAQFVQSRTFRAFETYFLTTALYGGLALMMRYVLLRLSGPLFPYVKGR